jgi:hypothetical protein
MVSPVGTWNINGNGFDGSLYIDNVGVDGGLLSSTAYGQTITGFWDDIAQRLSFVRATQPGDPSSYQIYTGYMMQNQSDGKLAMAGSFEAFKGTGAVARRTVYGWYARPS